MTNSNLRIRYRKKGLLRSGIFDPEFGALGLDQKLAILALLLSPFQYALTVNVGAPLKASEILIAGAIIARVFTLRRRPVGPRFDLYLIGGLAMLIVVSTVCVFIFQNLQTPLPGEDRSPFIDLGFYAVYGIYALITWMIVREIPAMVAIDVLMQASWLCFLAVVAQALFWFMKVPWMLESLGFFMGQQGWRVFGVALARSGPFLEGQHLGFFAGALFIVAMLRARYVTGFILLICVVYSRSTTAFAGIILAFVVVSLLRPTRRVMFAWLATFVFGVLAIVTIPGVRSYFSLQLAKFGIGANGMETRSLEVRSEKTEVGIRMMLDHLPFGVGPGRFAAYYFDYTDGVERPEDARNTSGRPLVENGYLHIGSELGIIALFVLFVALAWWLYKLGRGRPWVTAMAVFVYVGIATQSSWTFAPIWIFLGVIAAAVDLPSGSRRGASPALTEASLASGDGGNALRYRRRKSH